MLSNLKSQQKMVCRPEGKNHVLPVGENAIMFGIKVLY